MPWALCDLDTLNRRHLTRHQRTALALRCLIDVAGQLNEMHQDVPTPLCHNDVKPANCLLLGNERIILADMGTVTAPRQLKSGATTAFQSPALWGVEDSPTERSDLWSLGLTAAALVAPFPPDLLRLFQSPTGPLSVFAAVQSWKNTRDKYKNLVVLENRLGVEPSAQEIQIVSQYLELLQAESGVLTEFLLSRILVPEAARASAQEINLWAAQQERHSVGQEDGVANLAKSLRLSREMRAISLAFDFYCSVKV